MRFLICTAALLVRLVHGHVAAWHKGMYCLNGTSGTENPNTSDTVTPLFNLSRSDWWFHHVNRCDEFPPAPGDFLELPAGGSFTVELAVNRAFTTLSFNGMNTADFVDGQNHPGLGVAPPGESKCISEPNIHTQNESMAAGTAFAISYQSELSKVTPENLVVFTVLYNTPWKRVATYSVPAAMPGCPEAGCICAWGWVANGCGEPNMYMEGFKCKVTGATGTGAIAPAKPAVWCEDDPSKCIKGPKQMVFWNNREGNNIEVSGSDLSGSPRSPTYNTKLGFPNGAQNDIFLESGTASTTQSPTAPTQSVQNNRGFGVFGLLASIYQQVAFLYLVPAYFIHY